LLSNREKKKGNKEEKWSMKKKPVLRNIEELKI
jgi:hypothetical protein